MLLIGHYLDECQGGLDECQGGLKNGIDSQLQVVLFMSMLSLSNQAFDFLNSQSSVVPLCLGADVGATNRPEQRECCSH